MSSDITIAKILKNEDNFQDGGNGKLSPAYYEMVEKNKTSKPETSIAFKEALLVANRTKTNPQDSFDRGI